ncbi:MarR family winged helix-turn-helix transcriptional regulator [Ciceribacter naphthalenivorans]|nr:MULTISPECIES: MarR family transcriptional regulator [Alphaproteobacteria]
MTDAELEKELVLDRQLCFALYGAAHAFNRAYKPLLEPLGLTYPQYLVMMALWEEDGQQVKAIGEKLGLDSGTLSPLLKRLEQAGYVERRRDSADERQVFITLTEPGLAMKAHAVEVMRAVGAQTGCTMAEIATLRDSLKELKKKLSTAA